MTTPDTGGPSFRRRVFAWLSLLATVVLVAAVVVFVARNLAWLVVALLGFALDRVFNPRLRGM